MSTVPSKVKLLLNSVLQPMGFEIGTTLVRRTEAARLQKLKESSHWSKPKYNQALAINSADCLHFLEDTCKPFTSSFRAFPKTPVNGGQEYYLENNWFGAVDAEILYSFIRRYQPKQVIEVGSGFSTRLILQAVTESKLDTKVFSIDPAPRVPLGPAVTRHIQSNVEDVEYETIVGALKDGDLLFIDSSHIVRTGGDIPFLFLEVLPRLKPGVYVHIHDIFFPFDYSEEWVSQGAWSEQYLVHAFLSYNPVFEILWPASYMWAYHKPRVLEVIPANPVLIRPPSSLWLKKVK